MFNVLSDGRQYAVLPIGADVQGWMIIDSASTLAEGYAKSKKHWDHYWRLCGIVPRRLISVVFA